MLAERQTGKKLKILRSDNGSEYVNQKMRKILKSAGIRHQTTTRYTPQSNGAAERANRTIVEKGRAMLSDAQLGKEYWGEAVATAVYPINRTPSKRLPGKTPFEMWTGERPDLSHLRIFGCTAMAHVPDEVRKKWDPKSKALMFMGYGESTKGYRLIDPTTKKIIFSRDVIFFENETPASVEISPKIINTSPKSTSTEVMLPISTEDTEGDFGG